MFEKLNENIEAGNYWKHTGEMIYCEGAEEYLSIKEWQTSISYQGNNNQNKLPRTIYSNCLVFPIPTVRTLALPTTWKIQSLLLDSGTLGIYWDVQIGCTVF